jgi:DNA-binding LacI/PurR family transcriptional regulator
VGIEEEAATLGQDLVLFTGTGGGQGRAHDKTAIRRTRVADGCLFFGRHVPEEPIDWLLGGGFPLVYIGRRDELDGRIPFVGVDYVAASAAVVERLVAHRELRYLREDDDAPSSSDREKGVLAAARKARLAVRRIVVRATPSEVGAGLIERWRAEGVTAVVVEETDTGELSAASLAAVEAAGLRTPADLSVGYSVSRRIGQR